MKSKPHKLSQKDIDGRWNKKNGISYFGYKNHVKADQPTSIRKFRVTPANVHDITPLFEMVDEKKTADTTPVSTPTTPTKTPKPTDASQNSASETTSTRKAPAPPNSPPRKKP